MTSDEGLSDESLFEIFLEPVRKCARYRPAFGQGRTENGLDLEAFTALYGGDPFYAWIGLNDPAVYAAHRAAGGMTSLYRQIGVGSERLVRRVFEADFGLSPSDLDWSYTYKKANGKDAVHTLDVKLIVADLQPSHASRVQQWLRSAAEQLLPESDKTSLRGAVFEVRQGYKSADSKRQNADLRFGMRAYQEDLLPVVLVLSSQVSAPVISRYRADGMLVLTGVLGRGSLWSSFDFFREVVDYDLQGFFSRNSKALKAEVTRLVQILLQA